MELTLHEARVIGCLLEKEVTTPEQYPLSLNALTLACNQKTSRDPVFELTETDVQIALDSLAKKHLTSEQSGFGSRVVKYKHRFCNTEFSELQLSQPALAIVCLLLLRGPQTAGELRTRSQRLHEFKDVIAVEDCLKQLMVRAVPVVKVLPREAGRREVRYCELFSAASQQNLSNEAVQHHVHHSNTASHNTGVENEFSHRITALETEVAELKKTLNDLLESLS